jgi:hypothetical protein
MRLMASSITIDKGIAPPPRGGVSRYPFAEMSVGDSFFVAGATRDNLSSSCTYRKQRYGEQYAIRKVDGGLRVWRTA